MSTRLPFCECISAACKHAPASLTRRLCLTCLGSMVQTFGFSALNVWVACGETLSLGIAYASIALRSLTRFFQHRVVARHRFCFCGESAVLKFQALRILVSSAWNYISKRLEVESRIDTIEIRLRSDKSKPQS